MNKDDTILTTKISNFHNQTDKQIQKNIVQTIEQIPITPDKIWN
jgi:hypothetical protein